MLVSSLVKEFFTIFLDLFLVFFIDLRWVFNTSGLEIRIGELVCDLGKRC